MTINNMFEILKEAFMLNILDMNFVFSSPDISAIFSTFDPAFLPRKGVFIRIIAFFSHMFLYLNLIEWKKQKRIPKNSILFYSKSRNQRDSLKPVSSNLKGSYLFGPSADYPFSRTTFFGHLLSLPFVPMALYHFFKSSPSLKESFRYYFDVYWLSYGYYIASRVWLRSLKPKVMVMSNDHVMENRVLQKASKDEGIPTVYIQHASVVTDFPALSFDYALLDGKDALEIYASIGSSETVVFLVGIAKFDDYFYYINNNPQANSIGICTNMLDPIDRGRELCLVLRTNFPDLQIHLRPHPQDRRIEGWRQIAKECQLIFSESRTENSFEFLRKVDVIFAGNSNIHLEASLLNVYPIYYDFHLKPSLERYSFLKNNLCDYINNPTQASQQILSLIKKKPNIRCRAKKYCDTVDTEYDGRSKELACKLIQEIAETQTISTENWTLISDSSIRAYELAK